MSGRQSEDVKFAVVREFDGPAARMQGEVAREVLEEQGIPCSLPGVDSAGLMPGLDHVKVIVRKQDAEHASRILHDFFDTSAPQPPEG